MARLLILKEGGFSSPGYCTKLGRGREQNFLDQYGRPFRSSRRRASTLSLQSTISDLVY